MKLILLLIILFVITGCTNSYNEYRLVLDCRQCDNDEFCKDYNRDLFNNYNKICVKYGNNQNNTMEVNIEQ